MEYDNLTSGWGEASGDDIYDPQTGPCGVYNPNDTQLNCCDFQLQTIILPALFALIMLVGCLGNGFVVLVVLKNRDQSRNTTNLFILNLSVADLLFLIFCIPFHAVTHSGVGWLFGEALCKLVHFIQYAR